MDHGLHGREGVQLSGIVRLRLSRLCGPAPVGRHFGRFAKLDPHPSIAGPPAAIIPLTHVSDGPLNWELYIQLPHLSGFYSLLLRLGVNCEDS
jgi:hypothetical protein